MNSNVLNVLMRLTDRKYITVTTHRNIKLLSSKIDRHLLPKLSHFTKLSSDTTIHQSSFSFNRFNHGKKVSIWQHNTIRKLQNVQIFLWDSVRFNHFPYNFMLRNSDLPVARLFLMFVIQLLLDFKTIVISHDKAPCMNTSAQSVFRLRFYTI